VIAIFNAAGCAVGPLESIDSVFTNPQIAARGSLLELHDDIVGRVIVNAPFPRFARSGAPAIRPGPSAIGGSTFDVLRADVHATEEELEALAERAIIARPQG
jgi:crotonobetainyl-CoA:carnitine CoA-transferase CaiB-like acyl-CoA transferase